MTARLSLGPVLFNWPAETWRDFYFRVADEAPVDTVYVGEIVCSKRLPFFAPHLPAVIERLSAAGKEVVVSSPILVTLERERQAVRELTSTDDLTIEVNDLGCLGQMAGRPHVVGPFINVYNEATLDWFVRQGATRISLPFELPGASIAALAAAAKGKVELEVTAFGRLPLAISARCYHARAHGLHKDNCQFICGQDADGLAVETLDGEPFLAINGTQTMSQTYTLLLGELADLRKMGIERFRLSPHTIDMVAVATLFRDVLDGRLSVDEATASIRAMLKSEPLSNGFFRGVEGLSFVEA